MSQCDRILNLLKDGRVCGATLLEYRMPRYSARIGELRERGHRIETLKCEHLTTLADFVLEPSETLF